MKGIVGALAASSDAEVFTMANMRVFVIVDKCMLFLREENAGGSRRGNKFGIACARVKRTKGAPCAVPVLSDSLCGLTRSYACKYEAARNLVL